MLKFAPFAIRQTARLWFIQKREGHERKTNAKTATRSYNGQL